ncbi:MAG TPA: HAD family phosphatase [Flavobacteriales bacterium]|nr:HAD family phosphatase [Flavobacteriales bacterium]
MSEAGKVKNIIIDLGFVIYNIDYNLTLNEFRKLGVEDIDSLYSKVGQSSFFDQFERGELSVAGFYNEMRSFMPEEITDMQIKKAWNAMLQNLPMDRVELLEYVATRYRLFLLSNTNELHFNEVKNTIELYCGLDRWEEIFEKTYYSHLLGMRKPNADIYKLVLEQNDLDASETMFIDDLQQHLDGANSVGISTQLVDEEKSIAEIFSRDGRLV